MINCTKVFDAQRTSHEAGLADDLIKVK
jgi:hypothetical protein